jgi:hypothetical protein
LERTESREEIVDRSIQFEICEGASFDVLDYLRFKNCYEAGAVFIVVWQLLDRAVTEWGAEEVGTMMEVLQQEIEKRKAEGA